ncbi:MAG: PilZ domain-containing protein [Proteobacteria bacterium]|nr:PilZ domain-containing protein [Pseudomonadota bacterium]
MENQSTPKSPLPSQAIRLLLIDEQNFLTHLDKESFRQQGIRVYSTDNYAGAVKYLSQSDQKKIDVVSCNLDFHNGAGFELLERLITKYGANHCLWIATLVTPGEGKKKKLLDLGVKLLIHLPISKEYFIAKMRTALGGAPREHKRYDVNGKLSFKINDRQITTTIHTISLSGISGDSAQTLSLPEGQAFDLIVDLEGLHPIHLSASPVSSPFPRHHLAFRFTKMPEKEKKILEKYLDKKNQRLKHIQATP